ncbi:MAG: PAS domain-containing sensor histidine kinase, partial [Candidatus Lokiarchaeota archaeon]|nr:PAS domain-containing sensor histidine kinase [Candidatus Lokiarchaeota archaeon]
DQGIGISKEEQENLFMPYYTTKEEGTGLGLMGVKSILAAHGGKIDLISEKGKGTGFFMYLPIDSDGLY